MSLSPGSDKGRGTLDALLCTTYCRSQLYLSRQLSQLHPELTMPMFSGNFLSILLVDYLWDCWLYANRDFTLESLVLRKREIVILNCTGKCLGNYSSVMVGQCNYFDDSSGRRNLMSSYSWVCHYSCANYLNLPWALR